MIWLVVVFFTPLFLPYIMSPKLISSFIRDDYKAAVQILGGKEEINHSFWSGYINET